MKAAPASITKARPPMLRTRMIRYLMTSEPSFFLPTAGAVGASLVSSYVSNFGFPFAAPLVSLKMILVVVLWAT